MRIVCPQCGYSRDIPSDKVPAHSSMATCPKCQFRFRFRGHAPLSPPDEGLQEPVYPPKPSRTSVAPAIDERPLVPPFEPRRPRAPHPAPEPEHYGHVPPRPQARWLPDPEPVETPYPEPVEPAVPGYARLGGDSGEPAPFPPRRRPERPQPAPAPDYDSESGEEAVPPWERPAASRPAARPAQADAEAAYSESFAERPAESDQLDVHQLRHSGSLQDEAGPVQSVSAQDQASGQDLASEEVQPSEAVAGEDSVRDIWARLQAMGTEPKSPAASAASTGPSSGQSSAPKPPMGDTVAPWEQLEHYGVVPAFTNTIKNIMLRPGDFFDQLPPVSGKLRPLVFALVLSVVSMVFVLIWKFLGLNDFSQIVRTDGFQGLGVGAIGGAALLGLAPILTAFFILLDAGMVHLLLGLLRSATRPFDETFRTICYAGGPWILTALPVPYYYLIPIVLIWHMTLQAIGLKKLHQSGYPQVLASLLVKWSFYFMASFAVLHILSTRR